MRVPRRGRGWVQVPPGSTRRRRVLKSGPGVGRSHTQAHRQPRSSKRRSSRATPCCKRLWRRGGNASCWAASNSAGGPAQAAGLPVAGRRFFAARAVGHGQQGGNRQHQPVAAHARGIQAARPVPLPADGFQAPEALLNPVAAGIQGGLRLGHWRVGQ